MSLSTTDTLATMWQKWVEELCCPDNHDRHLRGERQCSAGGTDCSVCDDLDIVRAALARLRQDSSAGVTSNRDLMSEPSNSLLLASAAGTELRDALRKARVELGMSGFAATGTGRVTRAIQIIDRALAADADTPKGRNIEDDYSAFKRGRNSESHPLLTWHDEFARCPGCQHATVGVAVPYGINHAKDCPEPSQLPLASVSSGADTAGAGE